MFVNNPAFQHVSWQFFVLLPPTQSLLVWFVISGRLNQPFYSMHSLDRYQYGLGHPVRAFQISGNLGGYLLNTVLNDNIIVVVAVGVNAVGNLFAKDVKLSLTGPPALTDIRGDIDDLEGGKEAVLDALPEAVGIDRFPKVVDVGNILCLLGGGRHANLRSGREILQNLAPAAILFGGPPVALVHYDKIKEVLLKERGKPGNCVILCCFHIIGAVIPGELLIKREIDLIRGNCDRVVFRKVDFVDRLFQRGKVLLDGLVYQNVAVGQIEDLSF